MLLIHLSFCIDLSETSKCPIGVCHIILFRDNTGIIFFNDKKNNNIVMTAIFRLVDVMTPHRYVQQQQAWLKSKLLPGGGVRLPWQ